MSADSEYMVGATGLVFVAPESQTDRLLPARDARDGDKRRAAREARIAERARDAARWLAIVEAGGAEAWIARELRAQGLRVDTDPATLGNDVERSAYKERLRAEASARRELARAAFRAYRAAHVTHLGTAVYWDERAEELPADKEARLARALRSDLSGLETVDALCARLGLTVSALRWLCYQRPADTGSHYRYWTVPKRSGAPRLITAPKHTLKRVQRTLLRAVFEKLTVHDAAHGFVPARSIATHAAVHAGADVVVKVDLADFFPSITFRRVKGLLRQAGLAEPVATLCALLATESPRDVVVFRGKTLYVAKGARSLPQGAPTSPAITNAVCIRLDRRLSALARRLGFVYSRYADDLTFSWRAPAGGAARPAVGALVTTVRTIVEDEGFRVNDEKTSVLRAGSRQLVTGLVVNRPSRAGVSEVRVPREVVRRLRAAIHNREQGRAREGETLAQLKGLASFVYMADPTRGRALLERLATLEARETAHPDAPG